MMISLNVCTGKGSKLSCKSLRVYEVTIKYKVCWLDR